LSNGNSGPQDVLLRTMPNSEQNAGRRLRTASGRPGDSTKEAKTLFERVRRKFGSNSVVSFMPFVGAVNWDDIKTDVRPPHLIPVYNGSDPLAGELLQCVASNSQTLVTLMPAQQALFLGAIPGLSTEAGEILSWSRILESLFRLNRFVIIGDLPVIPSGLALPDGLRMRLRVHLLLGDYAQAFTLAEAPDDGPWVIDVATARVRSFSFQRTIASILEKRFGVSVVFRNRDDKTLIDNGATRPMNRTAPGGTRDQAS
jgi:hypothetical protein